MIETATADNQLLNAIKIKKASLSSYFEEATHYVEFEFSKETGEWWEIKENGYLAFRFRGKFYRFNIVKFKEDVKTNSISILGDYFNLEMLNENCLAYEKQPSRTIVQHLVAMEILPYANFEIGVNELASSSRVVEYTGEEMKYKRLISLINNFDGECQFEIRQKRNGEFDKLILNIFKANDGEKIQGVGRNRRDLELNIDNTNNISRSVDSTTIRTAIEPTGKDGLRLGNSGKTWRNNDGRVEFEQKDGRIYAVIAAEETTRVLSNDKWLVWKQNFDTDSLDKLESESYKWIKNNCYAKETIEVAGSFDVEIGDTVILNHKGVGRYGLLGTLRVVKIVWDLLTEENEVSFANFKRLSSKISAQGLALQESIETPASYDITFNTTAGQVFKNNTGASIVSFNFKKNGLDAAVIGQRWYNGTQLLSNGLEVTIKPNMLTDGKLNLRLEVDVTDAITFSKELTFINVNDGSKGADGNGIASTAITYQAGTSATVAPTGTWSSSPVSVPAGQFLWTRTIFTYTDTTTKTIYNVSRQGADGISGKDGNGIASTTVSYGTSTSSTTQPSAWTSTIPTVPAGQYLWTRTITDYTDASVPDTISYTYAKQGVDGAKGDQGNAGTSVKVSKIEYQAGTSATTAPTGTWSTTIVSAPAGQYLWSKTTMSDNSIIYGIARQGADGANGKDGQIPHIAYADKSTDVLVDAMQTLGNPWFYSGATGTVSPISGGYKYTTAGGTHQMKQVIAFNGTSGKNVYTYVVIKNTHPTNDLVINFNGLGAVLNGGFANVTVKPGQTYVDYRPAVCRDTYDFVQINILATVIANDLSYEIYDYAIYNTNPFINFSFASNGLNSHIGMYQDTNTVGSTDPSKYAWTLIKGQKGDQGLPGAPGADGKTPYWHTAWANSADGKTDFSLTDSSGRKFRGEYVDYVLADSTDPTKYKWLDMTANVKVGNNNLLVNTKTLANNYFVANNTSETYLGGTVATGIAPSGSYRDTYRQAMKIAPEGNEFIVSFYAKSSIDNVTINNHFYSPNRTIKGISSTGALFNSVSGGDGLIAIKLTSQWKRYWIKWTIRDANSDTENVPMTVILGRNFDSVNSVSIALPAMYAGNLNTEHSDAPEDTQTKIDSKADQALTQAQMLALEERSALARDNAIAEAMKNTISEVEAKWQTWYNLNTADEKQKVANDIASLFERVAEFEQNLGEASARFEFINNETLIGEEGVAIGDKEGKAKLFLSNDSISFVTNGVAQMTLTGDTLTIKNGLFTERIQIGNYVEEVYDRNPLYNIIRPIKYS